MKRSYVVFAALVTALLSFTAAAQATPIVYQLTGSASGKIGNTTFTNAAITLTGRGDTANVTQITDPDIPPDFPFFGLALSSFTINIGGVGLATVLDPAGIWSVGLPVPNFTPNPLVIFGRIDAPPDLDGFTGIGFNFGDNLSGYHLTTAIGPLTNTGGIGFNPACGTPHNDPCIATNLGFLTFASNPNSPEDVTTQTVFTARLDTVATPEPASLLLLGSGLAFVARKRKA